MSIYKKGLKKHPGNYRPVRLISVLGDFMEQISLSAVTQHAQDNQVKGRSCSTNLISFCHNVTCLMDGEKAVDVVYPDVSKAFNTVSYSILQKKLAAHGLEVHWVPSSLGKTTSLIV